MFRLIALSLFIGLAVNPALSSGLQGPRFPDQASRDADVAKREALTQELKARRELLWKQQRKMNEDFFMRIISPVWATCLGSHMSPIHKRHRTILQPRNLLHWPHIPQGQNSQLPLECLSC